jgi:hypothetical protein
MSRPERTESPLFAKTHDFLVWLFQHTAKFPRPYRHTLTERREASALNLERCLGRSLIQKDTGALAEADWELWQMRQLLRLAGEGDRDATVRSRVLRGAGLVEYQSKQYGERGGGLV